MTQNSFPLEQFKQAPQSAPRSLAIARSRPVTATMAQMPLKKCPDNLPGNIRRVNVSSFQPAAKVVCCPNVVTDSQRGIPERPEIIAESTQNYAEMMVGHLAAHSVTKSAWFHREFQSRHGSKTAPPFTLPPLGQKKNHFFNR